MFLKWTKSENEYWLKFRTKCTKNSTSPGLNTWSVCDLKKSSLSGSWISLVFHSQHNFKMSFYSLTAWRKKSMLSVYAYDSFTHQMPVYFFSALYASQKLTPATHRQQLWNCCCDWLRLCVARNCCCCCRKLITSGLLRSDCKTNTLENIRYFTTKLQYKTINITLLSLIKYVS